VQEGVSKDQVKEWKKKTPKQQKRLSETELEKKMVV